MEVPRVGSHVVTKEGYFLRPLQQYAQPGLFNGDVVIALPVSQMCPQLKPYVHEIVRGHDTSDFPGAQFAVLNLPPSIASTVKL